MIKFMESICLLQGNVIFQFLLSYCNPFSNCLFINPLCV